MELRPSYTNPYMYGMGHVKLAAIVGTIILVPCHIVKSLQLTWRWGTRRFNLRVPHLQMICNDFIQR